MKMIKYAVSALGVLVAVGAGLAFKAKAFTPENLYCFPHGTVVSTTQPCAIQSNETNIDFQVVQSGGSTTNPCPFIGSTQEDLYLQQGNTCTPPAAGTQFQETIE